MKREIGGAPVWMLLFAAAFISGLAVYALVL